MSDLTIFDADNHLYETRDAFTKFLPDRYRSAIKYVEVDGRTKISVRGTISEYIPNPTFDVVARPGAQEDYFRHGNPEGKSNREIFGDPIRSTPPMRDPESRLQLLDELGVEHTMMYPTLASLLEERLRDDPDMTHAVIHAFNEWLYETWQFNFKDRIFTTPVITLPIVERALEELDWVIERGARAVLIRPAPVPGYRGPRSFALPEFDPVWQKVVDNDIVVVNHGSDSGYSRYYSDWQGQATEMLPFQPQAFPMLWSDRPAADAAGAWVCHGAMSRFPQLKVMIVEQSGSFVEPLIKQLENLYKKMPQEFTEHPVDVLRRNLYLCPFWEEDFGYLTGLLGEDHLLFGSDWPHPEGLAQPASFADELAHLPQETVTKLMGGNLARLMGVGAGSRV
jgi:predicted TIM-barrel fold metal-dependent hydrolase